MQREKSQEIDQTAAAWAARIDGGPLSLEEEEQLNHWLSGDERRKGAFMRMRAVAFHSERAKALGPTYDPEKFALLQPGELQPAQPDQSLSRRRFLWAGGAALAASALVAVGVVLTDGGRQYLTRRGEMRVLTLEDESVITLNTNSRIEVSFGASRRLVILHQGEALFDVARDRARPFIVEAGGTSVQAIGTSFSIRRLESRPVEILVREGIVDVRQGGTSRSIRMAANTRVAVGTSGDLSPARIPPEEVAREIAWQSGRIAFEGATLDEAAATFARYSDTRIVVADPALGREEISGLFAANDPVSFARAAALSLDLEVTIRPDEVALSRSQ